MQRIIFDFDGTLANSLPVMIEIAEDMLGVTVTPKEVERYRNMTARAILKEVKIPLYRLPGLLVKGKGILRKRTKEIHIFKGLEEVIRALSREHTLYVVSSNGVGIINEFLVEHNIDDCFKAVYGNVGLFSKAQALKKVMNREGFSAEEAVYVGDEVRDIEAAKKVKLPIISVIWGYNGEQLINSYKPNFIAHNPKEIPKYIKQL